MIKQKFIHSEEIEKITNDFSSYHYLIDLGIKCYYTIYIEIEKDWFGIFTVLFIGFAEIAEGVLLTVTTGNDFGLIEERFNDVEYIFKCMIVEEEFSWEEFGKRKINFLFNLAVKFTVSFIMNGFKLKFNPSGKSPVKDLIKNVGKKVSVKVVKEGGKRLAKHLIKNDDWIQKIIDNMIEDFKKNIKDLLGKLLNNEIKKYLGNMIIIDSIYNNNKWKNDFFNEIEHCLKGLENIIKAINSLLKFLINLFNKDNNIFANFTSLLSLNFEEVTIFFKSLKSIMGIFNQNFLDYFKKFQNLDINAQ